MSKFSRTIAAVLFASCLIPAGRSWGWIDCGHRIVALVAWEDLTPKTKDAVTTILKAHHRYQEDLLEGLPSDTPADQVDKYAFAKAATWPDMVRSISNPMSNRYSHPTWHYIDIPIVEGNVTVPPDKNAGGPGPHNAIEAINQSKSQVNDEKVNPEERAVALCWIEHLIGDIHQPLHCATLYSPQYPEGDQGGNKESFLRDPPYPPAVKLHLIWDEMPGSFLSETSDEYIALGVRNDPRFKRDKFTDVLTVTDPMAWAKEGHELAWKEVYLEGKLDTSGEHRDSNGNRATPGVPKNYIAHGEVVAMHQVALGGYRLADTLNAIFDPHP